MEPQALLYLLAVIALGLCALVSAVLRGWVMALFAAGAMLFVLAYAWPVLSK